MKKIQTSHVIVGAVSFIIGLLLCHVLMMGMHHGGMKMKHDYKNGEKTMMMDHHDMKMRDESMDMNHDAMQMSMADMGDMLEGKTGDELDKAFLEGMIPHHQGAIDMAEYLVDAKHPELKAMGIEIISAQQAEIDQMNAWLVEWGYKN